MNKLLTTAVGAVFAAGSSLSAALLFSEGFDYGSSDISDIRNLSNYTGNTGVIDYDADGGLTSTAMNGEVGGALFYDFGSSGTRSVENSDAVFDPYASASAGDTYWISGLIQYNTLGNVFILFENGETVNEWGFGIDAEGDVVLRASDDGAVQAALDTGVDAAADGSTYLFVSRATIGNGTDSDKQSTVDLWFNPSDASSVGALGSPTFSTGADSKIGRSTGAYTELTFNPGGSPNARIDEIRFGDDLVDVIGVVPEPSTYGFLLGSLVLILALRRKR